MDDKTTYSVLSEMEDLGILTDAIRKEIVPITSAFHKMVYEIYLKYAKTESKSKAVIIASIESQLSERSVWYIIKKMES